MENKIEKEKEKIKKILENLSTDEFNKAVKLAVKELNTKRKNEERKKRTKALIDVGAFISQGKKKIDDILKLKLLVAGVNNKQERVNFNVDVNVQDKNTLQRLYEMTKHKQLVNFSVYLHLFDNSNS